ncbi:MAG: iron-containing alcohol dehydrogenase [Planctomycetota bacterium]
MEFDFSTAGRIVFGAGALARLAALAAPLGRRALLVTGERSADESGVADSVGAAIAVAARARCAGEPSVADVDRAVAAARAERCDFVVAVGGGSALDCGKAAAGMLTNPGSLEDYLEGVGKGLVLARPPVPLIAVPTTAGTGSEATKNAVVSGPGYKKSIRSPLLLPTVALVDPDLLASVPRPVRAACGLDALTQVLEPTLSRNAGPLTDALSLTGIRAAARALPAYVADPADAAARAGMALASLLGGISLANAGLGAVHGFASPLGAQFPIPHGVACGTMLAAVVETNLAAARGTPAEERVASRFAAAAEALLDRRFADRAAALRAGLARLHALQAELGVPRLAALGVRDEHLPAIVAGARGSSMRTNPVNLTDAELTAALRRAM